MKAIINYNTEMNIIKNIKKKTHKNPHRMELDLLSWAHTQFLFYTRLYSIRTRMYKFPS